jgi:Flp pilus assembly pilin Flp
MERIKKFLLDEAGTAEATSTVIMIAAVGILLAAGLITWYTGLNTAFQTGSTKVQGLTNNMKATMP